ncbi:hypothetical protein KM043_012149 [Ampulex compressa]|nr:hypothetical protein KM043_012149 [Ampulex compressa]
MFPVPPSGLSSCQPTISSVIPRYSQPCDRGLAQRMGGHHERRDPSPTIFAGLPKEGKERRRWAEKIVARVFRMRAPSSSCKAGTLASAPGRISAAEKAERLDEGGSSVARF